MPHETPRPETLDLSSFTRLRTFMMLRELIRKWWHLELFIADARGEPVPEQAPAGRAAATPQGPQGSQHPGAPQPLGHPGEQRAPRDPELGEDPPSVQALRPISADNDFCRLSLHAPLGARRCGESLRVTLDKLRGASRAREVIHECHLGFDLIAAPLWLDGELAGCVAVSGSVREPLRAFGEEQILKKVRALAPDAGAGTDLERALRRVPFLAKSEVEQLVDLLHACAAEITSHHGMRKGLPSSAEMKKLEADLRKMMGDLGTVQSELKRLQAVEQKATLAARGRREPAKDA